MAAAAGALFLPKPIRQESKSPALAGFGGACRMLVAVIPRDPRPRAFEAQRQKFILQKSPLTRQRGAL